MILFSRIAIWIINNMFIDNIKALFICNIKKSSLYQSNTDCYIHNTKFRIYSSLFNKVKSSRERFRSSDL